MSDLLTSSIPPVDESRPMEGSQDAGGIARQILSAPEDVWKKLQEALGVGTRQEAADLVAADPQAASLALAILSGENPQEASPTALTSPPQGASSPASTLYPSMPQKAAPGAKAGVSF